MKTGKYILLALALAGIAGCAANNAFVEGKRLIAEGKLDTGLASLEQAARENPDNLEIRAVLARQREAIAARFVFEAEAARSTGDLEAADRSFRRALEINPRHERALAGLEAINMDRRHTAAIKRAEELLERGEYAAASSEVRSVLQENPMQRDAHRLIQRITEMEMQAAQAGPILKTAFKTYHA